MVGAGSGGAGEYGLLCCGGVGGESWWCWGWCGGALLGFEGLAAVCGGGVSLLVGVLVIPAAVLVWPSCGWRGWCWCGGVWSLVVPAGVGWCFENCIVDASIFVAKFLRAHGGCLGTRNR